MASRTMVGASATEGAGVVAQAFPLVSSDPARLGSRLLLTGLVLVPLTEHVGLARVMPILQASRVTTVLSALLAVIGVCNSGVWDVFGSPQAGLKLALLFLTGLSASHAIVKAYPAESLGPQLGYLGLFFLAFHGAERLRRAEIRAAVFTHVAIVLVRFNPDNLLSGARQRAFRAGYVLGDGNDFAWKPVTILPLCFHLLLGERKGLTRLLELTGAGAAMRGVIGTHSRDGCLALAAALLCCSLVVTRHRVLATGATALWAVLAFAFAASGHRDRPRRVGNCREDSSVSARLRVLRDMAFRCAPGVGAGNSNSACGLPYGRVPGWRLGQPALDSRAACISGCWATAAFPGLPYCWRCAAPDCLQNARSRQQFACARSDDRFSRWPSLVNAGLVGSAVGGVVLAGTNCPHLFVLSGLTVACSRSVARGASSQLPAKP